MKCQLCRNDVESLENSHIIPECMYEKVYDEKHRFVPIKADNFNQFKIEQLGYRERLLCKACEGKLSKWEGKTKKDLVDIVKRESNFLDITDLNEKYTLVENINHDYFKKCMLSILWRMSIATSDFFSIYDLGPYEEKIRVILDEDVSLTTFDYPLMIQEVTIEGVHYPDLVMGINKGHVENKYIQQSFILYGFLIDIIISKHKFPNNYEVLLLSDQGRMALRKYDFMDLPQEHGLLSRFNDNDVKGFYE